MASAFVQFRADENMKAEAILICQRLGIDLQTYLRLCIARLISNNGIPFDMVLPNEKSEGIKALYKMNSISKEYGNDNMSIDEINNEINEVRK